jgi:hypothetical protein
MVILVNHRGSIVQLSEVLEPRFYASNVEHMFLSIRTSQNRDWIHARGATRVPPASYTPVAGLDCQEIKMVLADHSRSAKLLPRLYVATREWVQEFWHQPFQQQPQSEGHP